MASPSPAEGEDSEFPRAGELAKRVTNFRQRRANLRDGSPDPESSLQFDFEATPDSLLRNGVAPSFQGRRPGVKPDARATRQDVAASTGGQHLVFQQTPKDTPGHFAASVPPSMSFADRALDRAFEDRSSRGKERNAAARSLERPVEEFPPSTARLRHLEGEFAETAQDRARPIEFIDATWGVNRFEELRTGEAVSAPLGKRFLAGLVDALVLLGAGCVFSALFTLIGGRIRTTPLDLVIIVFAATFWIFVYFGLYSSITLCTPGQSALGLEVLNLDGEAPTRQEAWLRAFGYLVSIASLMLGFLWAAMDSDGMAWHDHISGTLLTQQGRVRTP